jgi:glycosyltransferase involved in cell wall biosynthesis
LLTETKKNKIITARLWPRYEGTVSSREAVISGLDSQRFETIIIYLMKNSEKPNLFEQKGYKTIYLSQKKFFRVFNLLIIWKLSRILKNEKIDILQNHGHLANVYGTIAAKSASVPVVLSHVPGLNRSKRLRRKVMNRLIFRWISKILTTGEAVKEDVLRSNFRLCSEKVISLGNSIDVERFAQVQISREQARKNLGLNAKSFIFGTVGRLVPTKGNSYLIEAFVKVKEQIPSAEMIFIGDGRLRNELQEQAANSSYTDSIHFLGSKDNVHELLKAMDVFVLSSIAEGMPRSLLEAMAAGVPCVATDVGGVREIIAAEESGLVVPPKDPQALAEAMTAFAQMDKSERDNMAEMAKQRVEKTYCHKVIIEKLQNIYQNEMDAKQK